MSAVDLLPEATSALVERALHVPATTTMIFSFELPQSADTSAVLSAARRLVKRDEETRLWGEQRCWLDENVLRQELRDELLSIWGLFGGKALNEAEAEAEALPERYRRYELSDQAMAWIWGAGDQRALRFEGDLAWSPVSVTAVSVLETSSRPGPVGVISVTGEWRMPAAECGEEDTRRLIEAIHTLRLNGYQNKKSLNLRSVLQFLLSSEELLTDDVVAQKVSHAQQFISLPMVVSTVHIQEALSVSQERLQPLLWRLRRGYGLDYMPPTPQHDSDPTLWLRTNQLESFAAEGGVALNWRCAGSDASRDRRYHRESFLRRRLMLYWHCQLEMLEMNALHRRALRLLHARPASSDSVADKTAWRQALKALMDDMVECSVSVNVPVCSSRSDYQRPYEAIRSALYLKELRRDIEADIQLLYDVYDAELKEEEARLELAYREDQQRHEKEREIRTKKRESFISYVMASIAPFSILSGLLGMNNFESSKLIEKSSCIFSDPRCFFKDWGTDWIYILLSAPGVLMSSILIAFIFILSIRFRFKSA